MSQTLDPFFTQLLQDVQTQSQLIADYIRGKVSSTTSTYTQRNWMIPSKANASFTPTDIPNLGQAFSRQALNQDYSQQLINGASASGGMVGNVLVDGLQINYLAMMERAFRERHKTDVRCQMHLCGRRLAHGDPNGVHTGAVKAHVQSFINSTVVVPN